MRGLLYRFCPESRDWRSMIAAIHLGLRKMWCRMGLHRWDSPGGHCEDCYACDEFFGPHCHTKRWVCVICGDYDVCRVDHPAPGVWCDKCNMRVSVRTPCECCKEAIRKNTA